MVREYTERDLERLKELHRSQGIEYAFPDLSNPLHFSKKVLEHDGKAVAALIARLTCEMFFLTEKYGTPRQRWEGFKELHAASEIDVYEKGLDDATAFLPPGLERFGRRLESIGWRKNLWPCYTKVLLEGMKNGSEEDADITRRVSVCVGEVEKSEEAQVLNAG